MKVYYISDFFYTDGVLGGAELVDAEVIEQLNSKGCEVVTVNSKRLTDKYLLKMKGHPVIISNFIQMAENHRLALIQEHYYIIYEHDHKYLKMRNPLDYDNNQAPLHEITNRPLYKNAAAVLCQTKSHAEILQSNIMLDNVVNLGASLWSDEHFDVIEQSLQNIEKTDKFAVLDSKNPIKNTKMAVAYCQKEAIDFNLIPGMLYENFIKALAAHKGLVFFPTTYESCCRLIVEARMLGLEIISSPTVGALSESWMELKGEELISKLKLKKQEIIDKIYKLLSRGLVDFESTSKPKVSIITSVFDGDRFIGPFLKDITSQTYFSNCELILVNCNSPGNEGQIIESYIKLHKNIKYIKLQEDPGVYGAWNEAIRQSTGEFVTNANLDDRRSVLHIEELVRTALAHKDCDLFYSPCLVTNKENETYDENSSQGQVYPTYEFSREGMVKCLPGPMPLWKRGLHDKHGYFDESYKSAGDWEMWLRFVAGGSKFKLVPTVLGLYYHNPFGLSTSADNKNNKLVEEKKVFRKYRNLFSKNLPENIERYFDG